MIILSLKDFMKKIRYKVNTTSESDLQRVFNYPIYRRDSKKYPDRVSVNFDNGQLGGIHWVCFIVKNNKAYYFDCFGGAPNKFLLNQLSKPIKYHNYRIQDINSRLCGSFCLYFC